MAKQLTIRGRVNQILKQRLLNYIESQNAKGRSIDESSIVRDATVEYLDARGVPVPEADSTRPFVLNDEKTSSENVKKALRAREQHTAARHAKTPAHKP